MKSLKKSIDLAGRTLSFRINEVAEQATASVITQYGETVILTTIVVGQENLEKDYFPLSVEYVEKLYAGGRIKGSRWVKREGKPNDSAVLTARLIDRSVRPLFNPDFRNDVQIVNTLLSVDGVNSPDIVAAISTACALSACSIPWDGPLSFLQVGYLHEKEKGNFVINPTYEENALSYLNLIVASTDKKVMMIECEAEEVSNETVAAGIAFALEEGKKLTTLFTEIKKELGVKPYVFAKENTTKATVEAIIKKYQKELITMLEGMAVKENVGNGSNELTDLLMEEFELDETAIKTIMPLIFKKLVKHLAFVENRRVDGRGFEELRKITAEVGFLPRTHGSALFSRGSTQVLSIATIGPLSLKQYIENPEGEFMKRYIHHYHFPPYSVGETGRIGFTNRREIGHGALAEKAVEMLLPNEEKFPYTIRVVSETLSSNGSTSMASTCASSLALMDAGVPIEQQVAGIAVGIIYESDDKYKLITDIIGLEDFFGAMDFKVAGTKNGITAIQLDVKNNGLTAEMIDEVFTRAQKARTSILEIMNAAITQPRKELSKYAPRVVMLIPPADKIGEIIGPGGKNIKKLIADTGCEIDIDDEGRVSISGVDAAKVQLAVDSINALSKEYKIGEVYTGAVMKVLPFGAVIELGPGKDGLLHVSRMGMGFVKDASEVVEIGQEMEVKIEELDDRGRIKLGLVKKLS